MDIDELEKKAPGSKLIAWGAILMLLGSITFGILALFLLWALWSIFH